MVGKGNLPSPGLEPGSRELSAAYWFSGMRIPYPNHLDYEGTLSGEGFMLVKCLDESWKKSERYGWAKIECSYADSNRGYQIQSLGC